VTHTPVSYKSRASVAWEMNWSPPPEKLTIGRDNITVEAGTYHVAIYPNCPGKAMCTLEAK